MTAEGKEKQYEKLVKKISKRHNVEVIFAEIKKKGVCFPEDRIIITPKPITKKELLVFFHEISHQIYEDNLEWLVRRKAKRFMAKELKKIKKSKK